MMPEGTEVARCQGMLIMFWQNGIDQASAVGIVLAAFGTVTCALSGKGQL